MFNNKKADGNMFWIIILAFLALVVGAIILLFAKPAIEKSFGVTTTQLGALEDFDGDKTANFFDSCPCTPTSTIEDSQFDGCPRGTTAEQSQEDKKNFKLGACPESALVAGEAEVKTSNLELSDGEIKIAAGSIYKTPRDSLQYKGVCAVAHACTLKIIYPSQQEESIVLEETGEIKLETTGRYNIFLMQEPNQQKTRYLIEKQE